MFASIVAGTDGSATSREAVAKAAELAQLTSAHLHVVSAFDAKVEAPIPMSGAPPIVLSTGVEDERRREVEKMLSVLANSIRDTGVAVTTHCRIGSAAGAIVDVAEREKADLIVVGNKGMRGVRRVLGSVPNSVAHTAPCAVMIVHTV